MDKFERFMQDEHALQYMGLDDEMPDNYSDWMADLSVDEWLELGEKFYKKISKDAGEQLLKEMKPSVPESYAHESLERE